ncbi:MAG: hypothetical protein ABSB82_16740 [Terriglobia bacterium]
MTENSHDKAKSLIVAARVEGISAAGRDWLDAHLETCRACSAWAESVERSITVLRTVSVPVDPCLIDRTRLRVHVRAQELRKHAEQMRALWISCALSWALGVVSAPLLWEGLKWMGQRLALPEAVGLVAFPVLWTVPAAFVGAVLVWKRSRAPSENGYTTRR